MPKIEPTEDYRTIALWQREAYYRAKEECFWRRFIPDPVPVTRWQRVLWFFRKYIDRIKNAYLALRGYDFHDYDY